MRIWDIATGDIRYALQLDGPSLATWNRDETQILTVQQGKLTLWDATTGQQIVHIEDQEKPFVFGGLSPHESYIWTLEEDSRYRIWDASSGTFLHITGYGDPIIPQWNRDETQVAIFAPGALIVFDAATSTEVFRVPLEQRPNPNEVHWGQESTPVVIWTSDSNRLMFADGTILKVVDTTTGEITLRLEHNHSVINASWLANETKILTLSYDNGLRFLISTCDEPSCHGIASIWNDTDGTLLLRIEHNAPISHAYPNHDSTRLLTVSQDGTAQIWEIP